MKKFEQPKYKITEVNSDSSYGKFTIEPLERGFGTTLGNALRRVLLSSLPGASVYSVEIEGAQHEFAALDGIEEDVTSIILNLKSLVLKIDGEENVTEDLKINVKGPCEITGEDIECGLNVEIVNKDLHIATVASGAEFNAVLHARNSRGYVTAENNAASAPNQIVGVIYTDSKYSPVERVSYTVEPTRVGQDATYDKLEMEIWTNGGMKPQQAIAYAAHILVAHLSPIVDLEDATVNDVEVMSETKEEVANEHLNESIDEVGFTKRSRNGLKRANIFFISDLIQRTEEDLSKCRNLGKKSIKEIKDTLEKMGLFLKNCQ